MVVQSQLRSCYCFIYAWRSHRTKDKYNQDKLKIPETKKRKLISICGLNSATRFLHGSIAGKVRMSEEYNNDGNPANSCKVNYCVDSNGVPESASISSVTEQKDGGRSAITNRRTVLFWNRIICRC